MADTLLSAGRCGCSKLAIVLSWLGCLTLVAPGWAQDEDLPQGFAKLSGKHLTLITDLPVDDDVRAFPEVFDQAFPSWCNRFAVDVRKTTDWRVTCYLMLDRQRFKEAGFIPGDFPEFPNGWQFGDKIWVVEQPSPYYRRHLLLHEGTHWFMHRKYGFYNTPWLLEGIAELLGTHRWQDSQLSMGIIPATKSEVPFWGRFKDIKEQCESSLAPSFEDILRYDSTAHKRVDAYAWSWAMVLFLENHPDTAKVFGALLKQPAMESKDVERWLRGRLAMKLPRIRAAWRAFVTDLDYGYSLKPGLLQLSENPTPLESTVEIEIQSNLGWQGSGIRVEADQTLSITSTSIYTVAQQPKPWKSSTAGVTLEYYRSQPLGKLMMLVLDPQTSEHSTELVDLIPVGDKLTLTSKSSGELFFKVNEPAAGLENNQGTLIIKLDKR
jgi:hypothetical protein